MGQPSLVFRSCSGVPAIRTQCLYSVLKLGMCLVTTQVCIPQTKSRLKKGNESGKQGKPHRPQANTRVLVLLDLRDKDSD